MTDKRVCQRVRFLAGAARRQVFRAQVKRLAASKVPVIAYVSCDVGSFARDAALLVAGGYALERVTPVDQFRYSAHIELVGVFRKAAGRK